MGCLHAPWLLPCTYTRLLLSAGIQERGPEVSFAPVNIQVGGAGTDGDIVIFRGVPSVKCQAQVLEGGPPEPIISFPFELGGPGGLHAGGLCILEGRDQSIRGLISVDLDLMLEDSVLLLLSKVCITHASNICSQSGPAQSPMNQPQAAPHMRLACDTLVDDVSLLQ